MIRRHLNYANVTATLALVVALAGGSAYAVDRITSRDIANSSIRSVDLKNRRAVRGRDVRPNDLTGRQISERSLDVRSIVRVEGRETGECVLSDTPRNCVSAGISVDRRSDLLIIATGNQESLGGPGRAVCRVSIDGLEESLSVAPGESATDNTNINATNGFARTVLSPSPVQTGQHVVALKCARLLGQSRINDPTIAVVAIPAG